MSSSHTPTYSDSSWVPQHVRNERRLEELRRYNILDTDPEPAFDRITRLAAHLFDAPTAIVNFIAADRQWFKSTVGFDEEETGLDVSFCVYTVEEGEVFVVENLAEDERFADNPYVTEHGMRFYAGAPLVTPNGQRLGTLCVLDSEPRNPSIEERNRLSDLAAMVVDELELRREQAEHRQARSDLAQSRELLRHTQRLADVGGWEYDLQTDTLTWTEQTYRIHDLPMDAEVDVGSALEYYTEESRPIIESHVDRLLEEGGSYDLELSIETAEGRTRRVRTMGTAHQHDGETTRVRGAFQDVTERRRTERLTEVQSRFFERIATGAPIDEVLDEVARVTERELSGAAVSIQRLDDDRLYHVAAPSLPEEYVEALDGVEIGPDTGTCGAAAYRSEEQITQDIQEDENWERHREIAARAGLRSCHSQVIWGSDETVLGTFSVYGTTPRRPDSTEQELVGRMTHVAGVALERDRRERALRESEEKFRTVVEHAQPVVFMLDEDGTFLLSEGQDLEALGLEPGEVVGKSVFDVYSDVPEIVDGIQRALDGEYVDNEVTVGSLLFDNWYSPFYDEDGQVAGCIGMAADITERRQAERELKEQKELLQSIFDNVPGMLAFEEEDITFVNRHFEEVTGWQQEELNELSGVFEQLYPDPDLRDEVLTFVEEKPDEWRDFSLRTKDGRVIETTWRNIELPDGRGLGIGLDISDRKERERELRETNQRLRLALDAANAGTFERDLSSDRVLWDERSLQLYGLDIDPEPRAGALVRDLVLEEDLAPMEEEVDRAVAAGDDRYEVSYRFRRADDGEVRRMRSYGFILRDASGTAERIIGINQDVTERGRRKEQLRLLEAAVEHSLLTVLITEADPIDEPGPSVVYANPALTEMTGYEVEEIVGCNPRVLQGPETDRAVLDRIRTALERDEPIREVVRNYKKDGTPYWNDLFIAPVRDEDGTVTHYVSIQNDITERVRQRETLQEAKEAAEEADRIKAALLSNMNHEFRTPLTSIITFSEFIRENPELADRFIDRILGGGRRLLYTLNTVMDFAELEGGGRSVTPKPFGLRDVVHSVANDFREQVQREGLDLSIEITENGKPVVLDEHLVERILTHLVHNAIKFTEAGEVRISATTNDAVELCVRDTGVGIESDDLPEVFDEFAQASSGYDRTHEGNGLGLTIVKRIVAAMNGTLDVESEQGEGTTVTVRLPLSVDGK